MKRIKNRKGFKICPMCFIEYPLDGSGFNVDPKSKKTRAVCMKCLPSYRKRWREKTTKANSICMNCRSSFSYLKNFGQKGSFCSRQCVYLFRKGDDSDRLSSLGLIDLNVNNYQKDFTHEGR